MNPTAWLAALAAGTAAALLLPPRGALLPPSPATPPVPDSSGWMLRWRPVWSLLVGLAAILFLSGPVAPVAAVVATVGTWVMIGRAEPADVRRHRDAVRRDLPHVVGLFGDALRAGQAPVDAMSAVVAALPGPATERLAAAVPRLRLGADPATVWTNLGDDPGLAPLGRAMARAHVTGAPVVQAVERLGEELARTARGEVEDRARAVGVKAAIPLGLCLLPAFVLLGIVPVVAGLMVSLGL
jgi:Flp pilus assembly protein TadB